MNDENALRQKAREAMQSGKLSHRRPARMWGGRGIGTDCPICGHKLKPDEFEFELQFASDGPRPGGDTCHVHIRCFAAWEFEREDFEASGRDGVLHAASDRDTITDRERDSTPRRGPV